MVGRGDFVWMYVGSYTTKGFLDDQGSERKGLEVGIYVGNFMEC